VLHAGLVDRLYGAPGSWRFQRCSGCGAAYLDPRPTARSIAQAYEGYYTHEPIAADASRAGTVETFRSALRNGYLNARYGYALRPATRVGPLVVPLLPGRRAAADRFVRGLSRPRPSARVLDVGCGKGDFMVEMRAAGWLVDGVDADPRAVARARERSLDVRAGTLEAAAYQPRSFDAVTLSHVLEHVHDPVATLRTCRELVRADGVLWLATPNCASPGHERYGRAWRGLEPPRHLVLFTPPALVQALERARFRLVSFQRPASARWVYDASRRLAADVVGGQLAHRLAIALADARSALQHDSGEELVALAQPAE
jgi:2-polyprenyl-3-methyl-5-hydroxy-6-metoxy-1,4-benzoquinol methylase